MVKFKNAGTKDTSSPSSDVRTQQALDQAAGGSGDIESIGTGANSGLRGTWHR